METPMKKHLEWLKGRMSITKKMEKELLEQEKEQINASYCQCKIDIIKGIPCRADLYFIAKKFYMEKFWKGKIPIKQEQKEFLNEWSGSFVDGITYIKNQLEK